MAKVPETSLRAGEPVIAGLLRICDALIQNAVERIKRPSHDREEDIHGVRITIKHLRAILRMVRPAIGEPTFRRENVSLKKTAQRLAFTRDITAGRQSLERLSKAASHKAGRQAVSLMLDHYRKNVVPPPPARRASAMRAVATALERSRLRLRKLHFTANDWQAMGPGLESVYRVCRKRMKRAYAAGGDEAFHRWRIRVKNFYYELQSLAPVWPKRFGRMIKRLKKLQDKLGDDHDLVVLKAALRRTPGSFGETTAIKIALCQLRKRSRKLRRDSRPLATAIFKEKPSRFVRHLQHQWTKWQMQSINQRV